MSKTKKLFLALLFFCSVLVFVGCKKPVETSTDPTESTQPTSEDAEAVAKECATQIFIQDADKVAGDIAIPKYFHGEKDKPLTWTSSNTELVSIKEWDPEDEFDPNVFYKAYVNLPLQQTKVTLTATLTYKGATATKSIDLTLLADEFETMSNANAKDATIGSKVKITGKVIYTQGSSFVINDGTENMYVYNSKGTGVLGQTVQVSGVTATYQTMTQIAKDSTIKKVSSGSASDVDYASLATEITIAEMNALEYSSQRYTSAMFKITGQVAKSEDSYTPYLIVNPVKPTEEFVGITKYTSADSLEELEGFVGKYVSCYIINYYYYESGHSWNVLLVDGTMALVGDGTYQMSDAEKVDATAALLTSEFNNMEVTSSVSLPTTNEVYGTTITWASSNTDAIANDGTYGAPAEDTEVTLTATVAVNESTKNITVKVVVKSSIAPTDIYTVLKGAKGDKFKVQGQVIAVYGRGFLVYDGTSSILVYLNKAHDYKVDDFVTVYGEIDVYNNVCQFTASADITKDEGTVEFEKNIKVLDGAKLDAILTNKTVGELVSVTGTLSISDNKYYNVTVEGTTNQLSISYPDAEALGLAALDGQVITVEGYVIGFSSGKYVNVMATSVAAGTKTYDTPVAVQTIAVAGPLAKGTEVTVEGQVVAVNKKGFMLSDGTATILVYQNAVATVKVGQFVRVHGVTSPYNGLLEIASQKDPAVELTITPLFNGVKFAGTPTAMDAAACDAYLENVTTGEYVSIKGTLNISGTYYNLTIDGATTAIGSLYYPLDGFVDPSLNGKVVIVEGFLSGMSTKTVEGNKVPTYVNVTAVKVYEAPSKEPVDPSPVDPSGALLDASFMCAASGGKEVPEGWQINVNKGAYGSLWQSFRTGGEYVTSPTFAATAKITVVFTYYLNNVGNSGNASSKIKVTGYNASNAEVASATSEELNVGETGTTAAKDVTFNLVASGSETITSIKIEFVKDGGGNIAFSKVVATPTAE